MNGDGDGDPAVGLVPFEPPEMLLTMRDGHGEVSEGAAIVRVMDTSGTAVGHAVPAQGTVTVDY